MTPTVRFTRVAALICAAVFCHTAFAQGFEIVDHETLGDLAPRKRATSVETSGASAPARLSFTAFGNEFDLVLERNDRLVANLRGEDLEALVDTELLKGELVGNPASWVRLVRSADRVAGLIWDGAELYAIEPARDVAAHLAGPPADPDSLIIYRASDVVGSLGDVMAEWRAAAMVTSTTNATAAASFAPIFDPAKQIDIGIVGDFEFVQAHPSSANARVLEIMNNVDAIFARHVGVYINLAAIELFQDDTDPFTTDDPSQLLRSFQDHKETTANLRDKGLAHLFTYRDLAEPPNSGRTIVGTAVLSSVCDVRTSVGVTQANFGGIVNSLIAAHEIGHNFGAPHDAEPGSACAATPATFLMAATVNNSDEFSACSIEQMRPALLGAACLADLPSADLAITRASQSPNPLELPLGGNGALTVSLVNGGVDALAVDLDVEAVGVDLTEILLIKNNTLTDTYEYTCSVEQRRCHIPRLPAGKTLSLRAVFAAPALGAATLTFGAHAANDSNAANDVYQFGVNVVPAVDVELENGKLTPPRIRPSDSAVLTFDLINRSSIAASNTVVGVNLTNDLEMADPAGHGCSQLPSGLWSCAVGTIGSLETKKVTLEIRARATATFNQVVFLDWTSTERYLDPGSKAFTVDIVQKLADLALSMTLPTLVEPGGSVQLVATIENLGPDVAEALDFSYANNDGIQLQSTAASTGTCSALSSFGVRCIVPTLGIHERLVVTMAGTAAATPRGHRQNAGVRAGTPDPNEDNNLVENRFEVGSAPAPPVIPPPPPSNSGESGGGGGGATDPLLLLACLCVLALRRAEQACRPRRK